MGHLPISNKEYFKKTVLAYHFENVLLSVLALICCVLMTWIWDIAQLLLTNTKINLDTKHDL